MDELCDQVAADVEIDIQVRDVGEKVVAQLHPSQDGIAVFDLASAASSLIDTIHRNMAAYTATGEFYVRLEVRPHRFPQVIDFSGSAFRTSVE